MTWTDWLLDLLCKIYQAYGENCNDFNSDPSTAVAAVLDVYANKGAPTFANPSKRTDFLNYLTALEAHLALPANTLSGAETASLTQLIADLRADLGAQP